MRSADEFAAFLDYIHLDASPEIVGRFITFHERLYAHNQVKNLTRVPAEEAWERHFADSLLFDIWFQPRDEVLDVGTGPGFPAWPLAAARPDLRVTAIDSNAKMLAFLRENPLPNLEIVLGRIEEVGWRERFDVVTGRAFAPLPIQLEVSAAACKVGGIVLPMRTSRDEFRIAAVTELGLVLEDVDLQPLGEAMRAAPIYRKVKATPAKYPRRWSDIKRKPLL